MEEAKVKADGTNKVFTEAKGVLAAFKEKDKDPGDGEQEATEAMAVEPVTVEPVTTEDTMLMARSRLKFSLGRMPMLKWCQHLKFPK